MEEDSCFFSCKVECVYIFSASRIISGQPYISQPCMMKYGSVLFIRNAIELLTNSVSFLSSVQCMFKGVQFPPAVIWGEHSTTLQDQLLMHGCTWIDFCRVIVPSLELEWSGWIAANIDVKARDELINQQIYQIFSCFNDTFHEWLKSPWYELFPASVTLDSNCWRFWVKDRGFIMAFDIGTWH